jgi:hypothetical protein
MTEMVTSGSMSGVEKRNDGLLGEGGNERRRQLQAPPGLHVTALHLDSTGASGVLATAPIRDDLDGGAPARECGRAMLRVRGLRFDGCSRLCSSWPVRNCCFCRENEGSGTLCRAWTGPVILNRRASPITE